MVMVYGLLEINIKSYKRSIFMKKSKIVSALMALALTVSPLSGINGFKAITDSPVKVSAATTTSYIPVRLNTETPYRTYKPGERVESLKINRYGDLSLGNKILIDPPYENPGIVDPRTGKCITDYLLVLQADGNLVVYNNSNHDNSWVNYPLYHTNSYYGSARAQKYLAAEMPRSVKSYYRCNQSEFIFDNNGNLTIKCKYTFNLTNGRSLTTWITVWNSKCDSIDRVI
jgi:hypothetical protein